MGTHRIAFVGGGPGSFVGRHHFLAATLDRRFDIVTGVFSQSAERNAARYDNLGIAHGRRYGSWQEMLEEEARRPDGVQAIGVLTPNDGHFEIVAEALKRGFHVMCDKPVTRTVDEARVLHGLARQHGRILAVSYNYSGYPMVRLAKALIARGEIGTIRRVHGQFPAGYLTRLVEFDGQKQAIWRTDPEKVGASAALMDLGTHVHHLLRFVSGLEFSEVLAELTKAYPERRVDDNAEVLCRLSNGATGSLWVSMTAAGIDDEGPSFTISGTEASVEWRQRACNELRLRRPGAPEQILVKSASYLGAAHDEDSRIGFGPPDGFIEAFANIYRDFADALDVGATAIPETLPTIDDGLAGLLFVEAGAASAKAGAWRKL